MVRHIVAWNFKEGANPQEDGAKIKAVLEGLKGEIAGLVEIKVYRDLVGTSNRQIVLDSLFDDEAALAAYQVHPKHVEAAAFVGSVTADRVCVDYHA